MTGFYLLFDTFLSNFIRCLQNKLGKVYLDWKVKFFLSLPIFGVLRHHDVIGRSLFKVLFSSVLYNCLNSYFEANLISIVVRGLS